MYKSRKMHLNFPLFSCFIDEGSRFRLYYSISVFAAGIVLFTRCLLVVYSGIGLPRFKES